MNPKLVKEWCAALRSGEYKQISGTLHKDGGFCCLGVLADIGLDAFWVRGPEESWYLSQDDRYRIGLARIMFLNRHFKMLGLNPDTADELADLNDNGASFNDIANRIELLAFRRAPSEPL